MPDLSRSARVEPSRIREIALLADQNPGTLRLFYGEDTRPTPAPIIEAGQAALLARKTFYTPNAGIPALRREIGLQYERIYGLKIDPFDRVVVTASGSVALLMSIQATLNPGDEAIVVSPLWPNIREMIRIHGANPVEVPLELDSCSQFQLNFQAIEDAITPKTRLIALASPSNPTGWTASESDWCRLSELCKKHDLWLLADTVYDRLIYSGEVAASSPLFIEDLQPRLWVVQSFSKAYRMTGWRVGWLVTPPGLWPIAGKLQEFVVSHASGFSQEAACFALEQGEPWVAEMVQTYRQNRDMAVERLSRMDQVELGSPPGAFYVFPKIIGMADSFAFCKRLVQELKLGIAPGSAFGEGGEGHVRICFAVEQNVLEQALDRFTVAIQRGLQNEMSFISP